MHFIIHGIHHDHPNDRMRLVMPPAVSIPLAALFLLALLADLRRGRAAALRRVHPRLPLLRLHALLRPPLRPEDEVRQTAARAPHAPPLPGPPLRLRRLDPGLGRRLPHPAAQAQALGPTVAPKRRPRSASSSSKRASGSSSRLAEQLPQAGDPVADGLRMDLQLGRHRHRVAAVADVGERRLPASSPPPSR